jgi:hypothetical protein
MSFTAIAVGVSALSAAAGVAGQYSAGRSAQEAADYNAASTRIAAKTAANDSRQNALRRQEDNRKYIAQLTSRMVGTGGGVTGGNLALLNETASDLQLRVMDVSTALDRQQQAYSNQAFRYDDQADKLGTASAINLGAGVLSGFGTTYQAGKKAGLWGEPDEGSLTTTLT